MKLGSLILFSLHIALNSLASNLDIMSHIISDLIQELFIKNQIHFDILIYGNLTRNSLDLINKILSSNDGSYAEKIEMIHPESWDHKIYKSAVIFSENEKMLNQLALNSSLESPYPHRISFLMFCESLNADNILAPTGLDSTRGRIPIFQYFLANKSTSVDLYTFEWYTEQICGKKQFVKLNSFDKESMKWNKDLVIDEKYKNFHGCMLTIRLGVKYMMTKIDRFSFEPYGPIVDFFKAMAQVGNFTYNYQLILIRVNKGYKSIVEDIPKDGIIYDYNAFFQMAIFMFSAVGEELHFFTLFREEKVSCLITPGEPYDSYEKLVFPFDFLTWIFLLVVFGCTFLAILIINFLPWQIQKIIYGENVMTPALNVGAIFFGMSQTQLPLRNFPRLILITFIMFCLVMRTAYQGVLFELIAADIRKPLPKTFHDLYEKNYTIHAIDLIELTLEQMILKSDRLKVVFLNFFEFEQSIFKNIEDSSAKLAFCNFHNILEASAFHTQSKKIYLQETLYSTLSSYYFMKHNFLYQLADETLQRLLTNGIIMQSMQLQEYQISLESFQAKDVKPLDQFSLNDLSYGFNLWIFALLISFVAFMGELSWFYLYSFLCMSKEV